MMMTPGAVAAVVSSRSDTKDSISEGSALSWDRCKRSGRRLGQTHPMLDIGGVEDGGKRACTVNENDTIHPIPPPGVVG